MKKIAAFIAVLFISLMLIAPVSAYVERVGIPRLDEVIAEVESDPDIATNRFLTGEFDFMPDMIRSQNIEKLQNKSHQILTTGGFHVCYAGINTRDYVPYDAGQPDANRSLAPLNWTGFRQALGWAGLSISQKESAIAEIYGPDVVVPAYTVIPEALGVWNNPNVTKLGGNYTRAEEALNASGFTISGGLLYQPNGVVVRDTIEVLSPSEAPTSVEFCQRFVDQWNDFFDNHLGVTNCDLVNSAIPFNTEVVSAFLYRNFDLYWLCWGLSRFPDYLYDFFHSSQDFPWGYNSPGINNATLDAKIETVKWGLVYGDKLQAAYEAQEMLVEDLVPYIYFYHRNYFVGYRGSDLDTPSPRGSKLVNAINQDGFGADNGWTWSLMHWNDSVTGGDVRYVWGADFDNLHPGWADSAYEVWLYSRIAEGLTSVTPDLLDMPWIALDWEVSSFSWPSQPYIPQGTKVTFRIRDDLYWADGFPIDADDIRFSWLFMRNFPRFYSTYQYLLWIDIEDPHTITAYLNTTSQFIVYDYAGLGLYFPQHIYDPDLHTTRDTINDAIWEYTWNDWMADYTGTIPPGAGPQPNMKAMVNAGSYYLSDTVGLSIANITRNQEPHDFFDDSPIEAGINMPGRVGYHFENGTGEYFLHDAFNYSVVVINAGSKDNVTGELAPCTIESYVVKLDGAVIYSEVVSEVLETFRSVEFDVPTVIPANSLCMGLHNMTVEVYEAGVAEPIDVSTMYIVATIPEDLHPHDFVIDLKDVFSTAVAFGSFPTQLAWDFRADINNDYVVDLKDYFAIATKFGAEGRMANVCP